MLGMRGLLISVRWFLTLYEGCEIRPSLRTHLSNGKRVSQALSQAECVRRLFTSSSAEQYNIYTETSKKRRAALFAARWFAKKQHQQQKTWKDKNIKCAETKKDSIRRTVSRSQLTVYSCSQLRQTTGRVKLGNAFMTGWNIGGLTIFQFGS